MATNGSAGLAADWKSTKRRTALASKTLPGRIRKDCRNDNWAVVLIGYFTLANFRKFLERLCVVFGGPVKIDLTSGKPLIMARSAEELKESTESILRIIQEYASHEENMALIKKNTGSPKEENRLK